MTGGTSDSGNAAGILTESAEFQDGQVNVWTFLISVGLLLPIQSFLFLWQYNRVFRPEPHSVRSHNSNNRLAPLLRNSRSSPGV